MPTYRYKSLKAYRGLGINRREATLKIIFCHLSKDIKMGGVYKVTAPRREQLLLGGRQIAGKASSTEVVRHRECEFMTDSIRGLLEVR